MKTEPNEAFEFKCPGKSFGWSFDRSIDPGHSLVWSIHCSIRHGQRWSKLTNTIKKTTPEPAPALNVVAFPIRPLKGSNRKRDDILRWAALRIALSDFEINLKLISKSLSAELSGTQRKMSSRFLFDPFKGRQRSGISEASIWIIVMEI